MSAPRVLVCGAWDIGAGYPRPGSLIAALRGAGVQVSECRIELPYSGAGKRRFAGRPWRWPELLLRLAAVRARFVRRVEEAVRAADPSAILVPYPGHLAVSWIRSVFAGPIVLDLFLSAHETLVEDRRRFAPGSMAARWLRRLDRRACEAADLILLDTPHHAAHVAELVGLPEASFGWVPITDPDGEAPPPRYAPPAPGQQLETLFFGTGVPLHGLAHLIEAVRLAAGVRLTLVGGSDADRALARRRIPPERLRMLGPFIPRSELGAEIERCHLVAGIFGDGGKAARVVPFKVVHALAGGRPVVTADTPAIRALLSPGADCLVCPPADPVALAATLQRLAASPGELASTAARGRATYERSFSEAAVGDHLLAALERTGMRRPRPSMRPLAVAAAP